MNISSSKIFFTSLAALPLALYFEAPLPLRVTIVLAAVCSGFYWMLGGRAK